MLPIPFQVIELVGMFGNIMLSGLYVIWNNG